MKVQVDATGVRFRSVMIGDTFIYHGLVYLKTSLVGDNHYYAVALSSGECSQFLDDTVVTPIKLMVAPEE